MNNNIDKLFNENKLIEMSNLLNKNGPSTEIDSLNPTQSSQSPKAVKQYKSVSCVYFLISKVLRSNKFF